MLNDEPIQATLQVVSVLEEMGIKYVIGGSLASALHGVARATMDSNIIADFREDQVSVFVEKLGPLFMWMK